MPSTEVHRDGQHDRDDREQANVPCSDEELGEHERELRVGEHQLSAHDSRHGDQPSTEQHDREQLREVLTRLPDLAEMATDRKRSFGLVAEPEERGQHSHWQQSACGVPHELPPTRRLLVGDGVVQQREQPTCDIDDDTHQDEARREARTPAHRLERVLRESRERSKNLHFFSSEIDVLSERNYYTK